MRFQSIFKNPVLGVLVSAAAFFANGAHAGINLKSVQVSEGSQIDFLFDGKIEPNQVKTEFVREHIQLSLTNVAVYPAKVNLIQGREMTKVFAYQFAPQVVRLRVSMKMDAEKYQNHLQVKTNGKTLTLKIDGAELAHANADTVKTAASAPARTETKEADKNELSAEEKKLLEPVLRKAEASPPPSKEATKESTKELARDAKDFKNARENAREEAKASAVEAKSNKTLTSGRNPVSPFRAIGTLLLVVGLFGVLAFFLKKMRSQTSTNKGIKGFLGKLGANVGQKKLISVVATMNLGPKKSISVVRIQNRMLVLGMTNESVNLITEFRADEDSEDGLSENMNLKDFADGLTRMDEPVMTPPRVQQAAAQAAREARPEPRRAAIQAEARVTSGAIGSRAVNSYLNAREKRMDELDGPTSSGPAFTEVLKQENAKASVRQQIRTKLEGLKPL